MISTELTREEKLVAQGLLAHLNELEEPATLASVLYGASPYIDSVFSSTGLSLESASTGYAVNVLIERGYVENVPKDPEGTVSVDLAKEVQITDAGREYFRKEMEII